MTLPVAINTITVTGTYLNPAGSGMQGTVSFVPSTPILVDTTGSVILGGVGTTVALNASGAFSVVLPCTGQLTPSNWSWTVTETIGGLAPRSYSVNIPHSLGSTVDISALSPIVPSSVTVVSPDWFNAKTYGATGNGSTPDSAAIQSAITAAQSAGGGVVYIPAGTYSMNSGLVITADNVRIMGDGRGSTVLKPVTGSNFDVISTGIPATSGTSGFTRYFVGVEKLTLDGTLMSGTTNGVGNGIHFYGARYSYIRDCDIKNIPNWGILLDGDATPNFSYSVEVRFNRIVNGAAGIQATFSEEAFIVNNDILQANATTASQQPAFGTQSNVGYLVRLVAGYTLLEGNVIGSSGTYTSAAVQVENNGPTRIIGNRFDQARYQAIRVISGNTLIANNQIGNASSVGTVEAIRAGANNTTIVNNVFDTTNGAAHYTYAILEPAAQTGNIYANNNIVPGTSGAISLNAASTSMASGNVGYNPVGHITSPGIPATTVAYTNNFGSSAMVYVTGGTVTAVAIGGTATGFTSGAFRVPANQTITLTYSVAPTWTWFLD